MVRFGVGFGDMDILLAWNMDKLLDSCWGRGLSSDLPVLHLFLRKLVNLFVLLNTLAGLFSPIKCDLCEGEQEEQLSWFGD